MKARVDQGRLLFDRQDTVVLLDGTSWSMRQKEMAQLAGRLSSARGGTVAFACLSDTTFSTTPPSEDYIRGQALDDRGRFVTPLVANGLLDRLDGARLIVFASGRVFDWVDWSQKILDTTSVTWVTLRQTEAPPGVHIVNATGSAAEEADQALRETLGGAEPAVELELTNGWLHTATGRVVVQKGARNVVWLISEASRPDTTIFVTDSHGGTVQGTIRIHAEHESDVPEEFPIEFPSTPPRSPGNLKLAEAEERLLGQGLDAYARGHAEHACPLCRAEHTFRRAFVCEEAGSALLDTSSRSILASVRSLGSGRLVLIERNGSLIQAFTLPPQTVSCAGSLVLAQDHLGGFVAIPMHDDEYRSLPLTRLTNGLHGDPTAGVFLLET